MANNKLNLTPGMQVEFRDHSDTGPWVRGTVLQVYADLHYGRDFIHSLVPLRLVRALPGVASAEGSDILEAKEAKGAKGAKEEEEEEEDWMTCVVCLNAPKTHIFDPCGHMCVCEACAQRVMSVTGHVPGRCPLCRHPAQKTMKVIM